MSLRTKKIQYTNTRRYRYNTDFKVDILLNMKQDCRRKTLFALIYFKFIVFMLYVGTFYKYRKFAMSPANFRKKLKDRT